MRNTKEKSLIIENKKHNEGGIICYYKSKNNLFEFDGNLAEYLISRGIKQEHIKKMKNKVLEDNYRAEYYFPEGKSYEDNILLEKVIGTRRSDAGLSVFENVRCMKKGKRDYIKFIECFNRLDNLGLEELKLSYKNLKYPVYASYYSDEDKFFILTNGNHRTLFAMLIGAECIRAKVTYYKLDEEKNINMKCLVISKKNTK